MVREWSGDDGVVLPMSNHAKNRGVWAGFVQDVVALAGV